VTGVQTCALPIFVFVLILIIMVINTPEEHPADGSAPPAAASH
jgi:hypothetical protein